MCRWPLITSVQCIYVPKYYSNCKQTPETPISSFVFSILPIQSRLNASCLSIYTDTRMLYSIDDFLHRIYYNCKCNKLLRIET